MIEITIIIIFICYLLCITLKKNSKICQNTFKSNYMVKEYMNKSNNYQSFTVLPSSNY